jgi:L-ascorbate metabolism protein UlaG (beta-lactamase superfamily)
LEITYLGHSAFRLRGKDVTVVTDPFPPAIGFSMGKPQAHIVTISHYSPNHSFFEGVTGEPRRVDGPGEYEVQDLLIAGIATSYEPFKGTTNTAYVFRFDDLVVCHLGDVKGSLQDSRVEEIGSIDVLLVPVGGGTVLGPSQAANVIHQLEPSIVIPMHYKLDGANIDGMEPVEHFCREVGLKEVVPEPKLTANRSSLPSEVRVVVLEHKRV